MLYKMYCPVLMKSLSIIIYGNILCLIKYSSYLITDQSCLCEHTDNQRACRNAIVSAHIYHIYKNILYNVNSMIENLIVGRS